LSRANGLYKGKFVSALIRSAQVLILQVRADVHPSGKYIAFQSSNNEIDIYSVGDKLKWRQNKVYKGHNVAGANPDVAFSPDGNVGLIRPFTTWIYC
jgi:hypothetical protein